MTNKKWLKVSFVTVTLVTVVAFWVITGVVYTQANSEGGSVCSGSTVGIVEIHGNLDLVGQPSADDIVSQIKRYTLDPNIQAIVIDIDSPGGSMTAADEIARAIKESGKKTIAVIRENGKSAAYLVASAADEVYAGKYSLVGNIGINGSILSRVGQNKQDGLEYVEITTGPFKDVYNPDRPLSAIDKQKIQAVADDHHKMFVQAVAVNRGMDEVRAQELSDGTTYTAVQALEAGLIDHVGSKEDALNGLIEDGIEVSTCS